jgi:hypothetical protein
LTVATGLNDRLESRSRAPPQFHAQYGKDVARTELGTLRVLGGSLPPRTLRLVRQWARLHTDELAENCERAQQLERHFRSSRCWTIWTPLADGPCCEDAVKIYV